MVAYSIEALSAILNKVPSINGCPTFKILWDLMRLLLPILQTIQHPDHPDKGMAGIMMEAATYALVSARPWLVPDCVGEVFTTPRWCIHETDQRIEERKWTVKKQREVNYDNLTTCLRRMFDRIIKTNFHAEKNYYGKRRIWIRISLRDHSMSPSQLWNAKCPRRRRCSSKIWPPYGPR